MCVYVFRFLFLSSKAAARPPTDIMSNARGPQSCFVTRYMNRKAEKWVIFIPCVSNTKAALPFSYVLCPEHKTTGSIQD